MSPITIGALARQAAVNVETIRYYERRGLLPEPPRSRSGYRHYGPDAAVRLEFIRRAQALGFTLEEIGALLGLRSHPPHNCDAVQAAAEGAVARITAKQAELERMRWALAALIDDCRARRASDDCPILTSLEEPS
ncbi:MAG: MerR family transcriptional regulator [Gemmatimonadales bacterium]